jgi:hypothetical protein
MPAQVQAGMERRTEMARTQSWTRNIPKKQKKTPAPKASKPARGIVDGGALENLKRRAEDLGLILHAGSSASRRKGFKKKDDGK